MNYKKNKYQNILILIKEFLNKCRESQYANILLASIFALTLFLQCCFFHYYAFNHFYFNPIKNPLNFYTWYFIQISISLLITSPVFLLKKNTWILCTSVIITIWSIANLIYLRSCNLLIDSYAISMTGNMNGFWDSILLYIEISDLLFLLPNIILFVTYYIINKKSKAPKISKKNAAITFAIALFLNFCCGIGLTNKYYGDRYFNLFINPFSKISHNLLTNYQYAKEFSPIHSLIYEFKELITQPFNNNQYKLNSEEINSANQFINKNYKYISPQNNLIIILVESLENWTITPIVTPNIYNFIEENNRMYCKYVKDNVINGGSSDGQFIINTGLLPVKAGATVYEHNKNVFPALSKIYKNAIGIIPGDVSTWNQHIMSLRYGFTNHNVVENDFDVINYLNKVKNKYDYILTITISSHQPYSAHLNSSLKFNELLPSEIEKYLKCINYADECLGSFLTSIAHNDSLQNSTIVITGDHKCRISQNNRNEFINYTKINKSEFKIDNGSCPLIIFSPNIDRKIDINEDIFQMDIYPTILHLIGAEDYYWKGFGVNLLDSVARKNRPISLEDAFELSDKLIRANYFKEIEDSLYSENY